MEDTPRDAGSTADIRPPLEAESPTMRNRFAATRLSDMTLRFAAPFLILAAAAGCRPSHTRNPLPAEPAETETVVREVVVYRDNEPQSSWPRLFLNSGELGDEQPVLEIAGLAVTDDEMAATAEPSAETVGDIPYDDVLRLLAYLQDNEALRQNPEFEARARRALRDELAAVVLERLLSERVAVSDADIRAAYDAERDRYVQPGLVSIRMILVSTPTEAEEVMRRIDSGESFEVIAREVSRHSSGANGGSLEPFARGTYNTALEDLAFVLRSGQVGTVETARGVFVVQKIADMQESVVPFDEVRETLRRELLSREIENERARLLEELRAGGGE